MYEKYLPFCEKRLRFIIFEFYGTAKECCIAGCKSLYKKVHQLNESG